MLIHHITKQGYQKHKFVLFQIECVCKDSEKIYEELKTIIDKSGEND